MRIISRYVLWELLQVFLVALAALTIFMLVVGLVREAQQQGLGLVQILMLIPYVLPEAMRFAVPGTMLFAVASVFGRMSASNEVIALKAAGISPVAIIWPAAALALVVSFVSVWLNDVAVSWGRDGVRRRGARAARLPEDDDLSAAVDLVDDEVGVAAGDRERGEGFCVERGQKRRRLGLAEGRREREREEHSNSPLPRITCYLPPCSPRSPVLEHGVEAIARVGVLLDPDGALGSQSRGVDCRHRKRLVFF